MKRTSTALIVAAAAGGLLAGTLIQEGRAGPTNVVPGKIAPAKKAPKVHGCAGDNECKGIGGCKTDAHACKFKNDCKGKGGCEVTAKDIKVWEKKQKEEAAKASGKIPVKQTTITNKPAGQ